MKIHLNQIEVSFFSKKEKKKLKLLLLKNNYSIEKIIRLNWTLYNNPNGSGIFIVLETNRKIIANSYEFPRFITSLGKKKLAVEIGEHFVSEKYRKQGNFLKIISSLEKKRNKSVNVIISTPNLNALKIYKNLDFFIYKKSQLRFFLYLSKKKNRLIEYNDMKVLTKNEYINKTCKYKRLNFSEKKYLNWRFDRPSVNYEFYEFKIKNKNYIFSLRNGLPGVKNQNILSESFVNKRKASLKECKLMIEARNNFVSRNEDTIFNANLNNFNKKDLVKLSVSIKDTWLAFKKINKISCDFSNYQLTDTDFG